MAINQKAKLARAKGENICHFGFGQSPFHVHPRIQIALANNAYQKDYLPTLGLMKLRENIVDFHEKFFSYKLHPENILIGPGSKELIFQALYVLEGPVLVPAPSWVSYGPQLHIKGKDIVRITTQRENSYKMTADELEETCKREGPGQKILILNNPSNPTGALYHEEEVKKLCEVCRRHDVLVISDEIYSLINFTKEKYASFHHFYPEGTLITSGLSKSHAAGGYRLGFLAAPPNMANVMKCLSAMVSETYSAVSAPIQYAAVEAYCGDYELMTYIKQCTRIHKAAGEYLQSRLVKAGLNCPKPEGAFYIFPDFKPFEEGLKRKGIHSCIVLANALFDQHQVAVLPGDDFYYPQDHYAVRMATVDYDGEQVYEKSLAPLLKSNLSEYQLGDSFIEENCPRLKEGCDRIERFVKSL